MPVTDFKIEYAAEELKTQNAVPVIIVAAGSSSRMGGINKMFMLLGGIPVIARTMLAFERNANVSEIIVVTKEENVADISYVAQNYMITKLSNVVPGGATRTESVEKGILSLKDAKGVMIHDGARPFVSDEIISKMADAALKYDCAVCGIKVKDTIKQKGKETVNTLDRNLLYAVQTPQSVNPELYKNILSRCEDKSKFTDDASVMESAGVNTVIIEGEESNIKITTPFDIKLAEMILREEE